MSKKIKDDLLFVISAFVIGFLYFKSQQEHTSLLWMEVLFVLMFAFRKLFGLVRLTLKLRGKKSEYPQNTVSHISAKY
jgi:biotin transporter BioY